MNDMSAHESVDGRRTCDECGSYPKVKKNGELYKHPCRELTELAAVAVSDPAPTVEVVNDVKGSWFGAMYDGCCDGCGVSIYEGDRIRADGQGGYECEDCGSFDDTMDRHVRVSLGITSDPNPPSYQEQASAAAKRHLAVTSAVIGFDPASPSIAVVPVVGAFEDPTPADTDALNVSGQPKARYQWRGSQNLGYLVKDPDTGDFRRYANGNVMGWTRATTFNKAASSTTALTAWSKRNVVIGATRRPDALLRAHGLTHADRKDLDQVVADLEEAAGAKVGADIGTYLHAFTEQMGAGHKTWRDAPGQFPEQLRRYAQMLEHAGFEPVPGLIERTTGIREHGGVVGTFDRILFHRPSGMYLIADLKTGKTMDYARDETFCQEWIYAHGVNQNGLYDWNTDTWMPVRGSFQDFPIRVSEEIGLIIHMPVQGDDAGSVFLEEANLDKGRRYAQLCADVRSNVKPKRKMWAWEPAERDWDAEFKAVRTGEEASALWVQARDVGVAGIRLNELVGLARDAIRSHS